jgi:chemotaxis protein histidine kinase CheA
MGMVDFFTMEAGEYLERLDGLVSPQGSPNPDDFLHLTRALRGSALMAGQQKIAQVSQGLEGLARGVRESRLPWDEAVRQLAIRAVDDLKVLVRAASAWGPGEDARAQQLAGELERVAGAPAAPARAEPKELDAGTRAFIAREGAAVGSALDRAAKALAQNPQALNALDIVARATQPLRGIANLADLPPMPDLLEGIERAIAEVKSRSEAAGDSVAVFDAAARAVSQAATEIAAAGRAEPDSPAGREFARLLAALLDTERDVVSIEQLYHGDGGPHIVSQGSPQDRPAELARLELVSDGEHLLHAASSLEAAETDTQRVLRAHTLTGTLRALSSAAGGPLSTAAAKFARAAQEIVSKGVATAQPTTLADILRKASAILSEAAQGDETVLGARLADVTAELVLLSKQGVSAPLEVTAPMQAMPAAAAKPGPPAVEVPRPVVEAPRPVVEAPQPAVEAPQPVLDAPPVVEVPQPVVPSPIQATQPTRVPVPSEPKGPELAEAGTGISAGFAEFSRLMRTAPQAPPPLTALLEGTPAVAPVAAAPIPGPPAAAQAEEIAPITDYCFSGAAALERAMLLQSEVRKAMAEGPSPALHDLIEEVFDLVKLGSQQPR